MAGPVNIVHEGNVAWLLGDGTIDLAPLAADGNIPGVPEMTREELDAKLELVREQARAHVDGLAERWRADAEIRQANWREQFQSYSARIDSQVEASKALAAQWRMETQIEVAEIKKDGRATRLTVVITGASVFVGMVAVAIGIWQANIAATANMIAAFQSGLGVKQEIRQQNEKAPEKPAPSPTKP